MPEPENGRATIREVYALVSEVRADIAQVDEKVDALAALPQANATRLALIEKACLERPKMCALEVEKTVAQLAERRTTQGWARLQRYGWVAATAVAIVSAILGWTH